MLVVSFFKFPLGVAGHVTGYLEGKILRILFLLEKHCVCVGIKSDNYFATTEVVG